MRTQDLHSWHHLPTEQTLCEQDYDNGVVSKGKVSHIDLGRNHKYGCMLANSSNLPSHPIRPRAAARRRCTPSHIVPR